MKTMLKVALLFACVALANTLFAAGNLNVNILPLNNEKAVVAISSLSNSDLSITITNDEGDIVYYRENAGQYENYRRVFNFSDLEDGTYKLKVVSGDLTGERQFQKKHDKISVGNEKTTLKPFFGYRDNILRCTYLNFTNEDVVLHFYDNNQEILYEKVVTGFSIQEAINLSKLKKGNYEAVLTAGNKLYSYNLEIK